MLTLMEVRHDSPIGGAILVVHDKRIVPIMDLYGLNLDATFKYINSQLVLII